ncbi:MAG: hemolysin family protein [Candidatus Euphemobacter frigidus]|nr:hemolysin family protein [Candidatus Euphemobacter frigidus]MDP8276276.1 hemolysin family protein [Candidatus Euphemobacter frigidus]
MTIGVCLIIIVGCLLLQAFFCASEMALVSANRLRVRHLADSGSRRAQVIQALLEAPEKFLSTTLVGVNLFLVLGATIASYLLSYRFQLEDRGAFLAAVIMLPLILIFAEIIPKNLVRPRATRVSLLLSFPLQVFYYLFYPLVQVVSWLSRRFLGLLGISPAKSKLFTSVDDIRLLMEEGRKQGVLTEDEEKMIARVFDFGETEVSEIMLPLIDVTVAPEDSTVDNIRRIISESGHTRIPIYRERVDKIIGTVQVTDLLMTPGNHNIATLIREPYIVPESKPLDELLEELRNNDVNMAIVVDEYGGVAGIATLENIIEEIVGEIRDEYDLDEVSLFRMKGNAAEVSGRMRLDELNDILNLDLPEDKEEETIAGFLIDLLGKIPSAGEKINYGDHLFTITQATDRRVVRLEITGPAVEERRNKIEKGGDSGAEY